MGGGCVCLRNNHAENSAGSHQLRVSGKKKGRRRGRRCSWVHLMLQGELQLLSGGVWQTCEPGVRVRQVTPPALRCRNLRSHAAAAAWCCPLTRI